MNDLAALFHVLPFIRFVYVKTVFGLQVQRVQARDTHPSNRIRFDVSPDRWLFWVNAFTAPIASLHVAFLGPQGQVFILVGFRNLSLPSFKPNPRHLPNLYLKGLMIPEQLLYGSLRVSARLQDVDCL